MTWVFEKAKERAEEHSIEVISNPNPKNLNILLK